MDKHGICATMHWHACMHVKLIPVVWMMQLYRLQTIYRYHRKADQCLGFLHQCYWSTENRRVLPTKSAKRTRTKKSSTVRRIVSCSRRCVTTDRKHVLHDLIPLPSVASQNYNLRQRRHNLKLPISKSGHLRDCNFIQRLLFLDCYLRLTLLF